MYPKHVELRIHQQNYLVASSWHFTFFYEEGARSNNPQVPCISFADIVCDSDYVIERLIDIEEEGKFVLINTKRQTGGVEV